mmetsp:Transcript_12009/g.18931  ORF Transcript_12009/g.18931 Transcript_12009/m.18931 type:complete len:86 (-) Transcript_12009:317-574(-)
MIKSAGHFVKLLVNFRDIIFDGSYFDGGGFLRFCDALNPMKQIGMPLTKVFMCETNRFGRITHISIGPKFSKAVKVELSNEAGKL